MASVSWTATTGGTWSTGSNWSTGTAPMRADDVTISTAASATITYTTGALTINSLVLGVADTLSLTGGTLAVEAGYSISGALAIATGQLRLVNGTNGNSLDGNISQTSGTLTIVGGAIAQASSQGSFSQTGGLLTIAGGVLADYDTTTTIDGTLAGNGALVFESGDTAYLGSAAVVSIANLDVGGGTLNLQGALTYAHDFQDADNGTLSLNNEVLTLTGTGALDGVVTNGGTIVEAGHGIINGLTLNNGSVVNITAVTNETGIATIGAVGGGSLDVASTGTLRITGNDYIYNGSGGGTITNLGTISKVGGSPLSGAAVIETQINTSGTINAAVGTIEFYGPNSPSVVSNIDGTLSGAGTIEFTQGYYELATTTTTVQQLLFASSTNVTLASALTYAGSWDQTGGLLLFNNNLTLNGSAAFDGGEVKGTGTVTLGAQSQLHLGTGMDLEGNLTFLLEGPVVQTGAINLGYLSDSVDQATLTAGNSWDLEGAAQISGAYGTITDLGTFVKLNGAQNSVVASNFTNESGSSSGTVLVDSGTLTLSGHGTLGGVVGGSAALDIGGAFVLDSGLALSVGEFIVDTGALVTLNNNLIYKKNFASESGTTALNNHTLTLSGTTSLLAGAFANTGEVILTGAAVIGEANATPFVLSQGADLMASGATQQAGSLLMTSGASSPTLTVGAGGVYTVDPGLSSTGSIYIGNNPAQGGPSGSVVVTGSLVASGLGLTQLDAAVVNNGSIVLQYGDLQFLGPVSGTGSITVSHGGTLDVDTSYQVNNAITFGTGGGALILDFAASFGGTINGFASGDVIALTGFTYSATSSFTISGDTVAVNDGLGHSTTLTFGASPTGSLLLGEGPTGQLALVHL